MLLKLIVIRTANPKYLANFYNILGLTFDYHKHGNGSLHYATMLGQTVLEIYPLAKNQIEADKNLRLGFEIDNWEEVLERLKATYNIKFLIEPTETEFGYMTIIQDPDGRKIELYRQTLQRKAVTK